MSFLTNKCLNCGKLINDSSEVCSQKCANEYYEYVFEEPLSENPNFKTKISK